MMRNLLVILVLCGSFTNIIAQNLIIEKMVGTWEGKGNLQGTEASFQMSWEKALDGKFVRLSFVSKRKIDSTRNVLFKASAMYKPQGENWIGTWYDSRGMVLPLLAKITGLELVVVWGEEQSEKGRTIYRIISPNEMEVTDFVLVKDEYKKFAEAKYKKLNSYQEQPQVTGIGGIFFKSSNVAQTRAWYHEKLGIINSNQGGSFLWRKYNDQENYGFTVWHAFDQADDYFKESAKNFMVNYRVNDLNGLLKKLKEQNVKISGEIESYPFGRFAWIIDPEGQKIELWEPADPEFLELINDNGEQVYNLSN
ncbi:MAG: VOC family protein [Candidatus Cyclobacteriaceae bacterium M3_2C_046]